METSKPSFLYVEQKILKKDEAPYDESVKSRSGRAGDENCVLSDQSDQWQKGKFLGRGSVGPVYEGFALDDGFHFAVKEVSLLDQDDEGKQLILQLEQDIALLSQFEHENIVQYYGTKKDESKLYIFLELVTKGSLLSLYQKYTLPDSQVWSYTRQILHGLKYLHDRNVVHGDVRCANILVDTNGSVKLADFGLAKATKLNYARTSLLWMAPEVVRSGRYGLPVDISADIWSLGCTVLEMLTRSFPYSNLEFLAALYKIGRGERPAIPKSVSNVGSDFILKCLQVDPSLRPTAAELLDHPLFARPLPSPSTSSGFSNIPSPLPPLEKVFGRYFEKKILLSKLLYSDTKATQLSTVPVLGVCGIGKTTLARQVYKDDAVKEHFQLRAWVKVHGSELKLHLAAQGILKYAMGMSCSVDDMDELDEMVRDVLHSNRCLIVFDDIESMSEDSWLHMNQHWFGFVDLGSRVLITTPNKVVANLVAENPFVLSRLSMDDCLSLIRHLSFGSSEGKVDMSESLAQDVAALCQGNPLLLKLVVSQIRFDDSLSNRFSSDGILLTNSDELAVVMMCVFTLPPHLRGFLAYCSLFPQGYAMDKEKIIRMCIADGFVMMSSGTNDAKLEDIGESYLRQLLHRSFFEDMTRDGYGGITDFQVPGLIHKAVKDYAATRFEERFGVIGSVDENGGHLSIVLPASGEYDSSHRLRVLIFSPPIYVDGSSLDHSLVEFKSLVSLDLSCSGIGNLLNDIGWLKELRYLNLSYTLIESLPGSIAALSELRTVDLSWCFHLKILPEGMRKLTHMRHLDLARCESLSYFPSGIEHLTSLHSMPLFVLGEDRGCAGLAELGSLNNLRGRLEIRNLENVRKDSEAKDAKLERKNIHHLGLSWSHRNTDNCYNVLNDLKPHENLQGTAIAGPAALPQGSAAERYEQLKVH